MNRDSMFIIVARFQIEVSFFLEALAEKVEFNSHIGSLLNQHLVLSTEECQKELVFLSPACLGFKDAVKRVDFFQRAQEQGYKLCNLETILQYLLQHGEAIQQGEIVLFAMEPLPSNQSSVLHTLGYARFDDDKVLLMSDSASDDQSFVAHFPWLFCK